MSKFDLVEAYAQTAKGIAWDTCHKIYMLMDNNQVAVMREYGYDPLITSDEMTPEQMTDTLEDWFNKSCGLRFIQAVSSVPEGEDEDERFENLIGQFEVELDDEDDEDY